METHLNLNSKTGENVQCQISLLLISEIRVNIYFSFKRMHCLWVCDKSNTTGVTTGAGTSSPSGTLELTIGFYWGSCARSLVFSV